MARVPCIGFVKVLNDAKYKQNDYIIMIGHVDLKGRFNGKNIFIIKIQSKSKSLYSQN